MALYKIVVLLVGSCFCFPVWAQVQKAKGKLASADSAELTILNVYPESFPNVSVVFRAETRSAEPVWNLSKEKLTVTENLQTCRIVSLDQLSKKQPITLGIVIDHSGSMMDDPGLLYDESGNARYGYDEHFNPVYPKGYKTPMQNAKAAVKEFVRSFDSQKDFISVTGFSSTVDKRLPLTQDQRKINAIVDSMTADGSTALYDAMNSSIEELKNLSGVKVLVVLTDGRDNASRLTCAGVIAHSIKENVPVYIIGLGNVSKDTLELMAKATHGQSYFTQSSSSLDTVYGQISKQVQAFYNVVYTSPSISSSDSVRQLEISFDVDSLALTTHPAELRLPTEVIAFMKKKETEKEYLLFGGIATLLVVSTGTLLFRYRRKNGNKPVISKLYPNPTSGNITVEFTSNNGKLQIINSLGQVVKIFETEGGKKDLDLSGLPNGTYTAILFSNGGQSNAFRFIIEG